MKSRLHVLTARAHPPRAPKPSVAHRQAAEIAKWLKYCMDERLHPRSVLLGDEQTSGVVGFKVGCHSKGEYALPATTRSGQHRLSDLLGSIQSVRPEVYRAAVEIVGGMEWRKFQMGWVARGRR